MSVDSTDEIAVIFCQCGSMSVGSVGRPEVIL